MTRLSFITAAILCLAAPGLAQHKQEQQQNVTTTMPPEQQQQQGQQNATTSMPSQHQNTTATTPVQGHQNATTGTQQQGGQGEQRPSALSQLEVLMLGNHSGMDPNQTHSFFQNDYQIVNHSPHEICNVSLSAPLENPERTWVSSSYNAQITNSTRKRGIDIMTPAGDTTSIPANGVLNIGYILQQAVQSGQGAMGNMTTMAGGHAGAVLTIESAQYCDQMPGHQQQQQQQQTPQGGQTNVTTGGMTGGAGNMTTGGTTGGAGNMTTGGTTGQEQTPKTTGGGARAKTANGKKPSFRHV